MTDPSGHGSRSVRTDTLERGFDLVVAGLFLLLLAPLIPLIALVVKLTSRGPVLHRGRRVGKNGEVFDVLKFRTMEVGAERHGPGVTAGDDPRITTVGRVLRKLRLDEIPQLLNVLRGDMSVVGPRPEDPKYVARYSREQTKVLEVRPGMASPAFPAYRQEEELLTRYGGDLEAAYVKEVLPRKLEMELRYVEERSVLKDVTIFVRCVMALLRPPSSPADGPGGDGARTE